MSLKLNVGLSKKLGLPNYGSVGASCYVEVELDQSLLFDDLDGFHERVHSAFTACRQAVGDELARQRSDGHVESIGYESETCVPGDESANHKWSPPPPSAKQMAYARKLAGQIPGLGGGHLDPYCQQKLGKPLAELTAAEASALIDVLKNIRSGRTLLGEAEKGEAA